MNKFKIGDIVKININYEYIPKGAIGVVLEDDDQPFINWNIHYRGCYEKMIDGKIYYNVYAINEDDLCLETIKTKEELFNLPLGTIIKTNRPFKNIYIKVGEKDFCNNDCDHINDSNVDNDLTIVSYYGDKILEIQTPDYNTFYKYEEPKKPTREMTIEEIEKELGYPIKVIKEN